MAVWCTHEMVPKWRAGLFDCRFPLQVGTGIALKRYTRAAALLGTVMHQPVLTDIEKAASSAAMPAIRQTLRDVPLETVVLREGEHLPVRLEKVLVNRQVIRAEGPELAIAIVQNAHRAGESELARARR
jgi:hypothetical protein